MGALAAAFWGFVGGGALLVGAALGLYAGVSRRLIAIIMAVGAGVLISSVAFDLMDEAYRRGGLDAAAVGILLGGLAYFLADRAVTRRGGERRKSSGDEQGGSATAIAIGALLDGVPESAAIGITLIEGGGVGIALVAAVFLSNIPEALSSAAGMKQSGRSNVYVFGIWGAVTLASTLAALLGYTLLAGASGDAIGGIQAFAAGAILTMLGSTMFPEAYENGGPVVGIFTTAGFLLAFILSRLG